MELSISILVEYVRQLPLLLLFGAGIIRSLYYWRRAHPASKFALLAFSIFLLESLIGSPVSTLLPQIVKEHGGGVAQLGALFSVLGLIRALINTSAYVLLLFALFGPQGQSRRTS